MTGQKLRWVARWLSLAAIALLAGCQGMYVHNPERAASAEVAKKNIETVDIDAVSKVERENISRLTAEAVKSLEAREKLVARLGVLQLAAGEETIERHYQRARKTMEADLGTSDMFALKEAGDCKIKQALKATLLDNLKDQLKDFGHANAPACKSDMPASLPFPATLITGLQQDFSRTYAEYRSECVTASPCDSLDIGGELAAALEGKKKSAAERKRAKDAVDSARLAYDNATKANAATTQAAGEKAKHLQDKAQDLVDAVDKLAKVAPDQANRIKASALLELLTAAASGVSVTPTSATVAASPTKPPLTTASAREIAGAIPSLAQSIAAAKAAGQQVPTAHLLLALNDVMIVGERDDRLAELDEEEILLLERKVKTREEQAALWRRYSDQLCKLAVSAANKPAPAESCGTIEFTAADGGTCLLTLKGKAAEPIPHCILARSWRSLFGKGFTDAMEKGKVNDANKLAAGRELHEAVVAYLQVRMNAYQHVIADFHRYDVGHRRVIVRREASLEQWKNIVSLPATELNAYYSGGVKPAEIADLLVKALGFTAVAIGVSK
jgi:hypothetical protein